MEEPIASTRIRGRIIMLDLYKVDMENRTVTIGIGNTPKSQKDIRTSDQGDYFVHGCTKYYLSEFEGSFANGR